jgi:hypothetical protein
MATNYAASYAVERDPNVRFILTVCVSKDLGVLRVIEGHATMAAASAHSEELRQYEHWRGLDLRIYDVRKLKICYVRPDDT